MRNDCTNDYQQHGDIEQKQDKHKLRGTLNQS